MHAKPPRPTLLPGFVLKQSSPGELGYDPQSDSGQRILQAAATFAAALREQQAGGGSGDGTAGSSAGGNVAAAGAAAAGATGGAVAEEEAAVRVLTVAVMRQLNVELVVARGLPLARQRDAAAEQLR